MSNITRRRKAVVLLVLGLCFYALMILAVKLWVYPGWTWKGYLSDFKTTVGLILAFCTPIAIIFKKYKQKPIKKSLLDVLETSLTDSFAGRAALLSSGVAVLTFAILILGERTPSPKLLQLVDSRNWDTADDELKRISADPLRRDVVLALTTYVRVNESVEQERFDGTKLHKYRDNAMTLLQTHDSLDPFVKLSYYMVPLNSLSFAEASKGDFLNEPAPIELKEAQEQLQRVLPSVNRKPWKVAMLEKLGELYLVDEKYNTARRYFETALKETVKPTERALLTGLVANTLSAEGRNSEAVESYKRILDVYPENRKYIYHSNLGYLLFRAGRFQEATDELKIATHLKPKDWVSHLNLALVDEAEHQYDDAADEYQEVLTGAAPAGSAPDPPVYRECLILMGHGAELQGKPFETFAGYYLEADDRSHSPAAINNLNADLKQKSALYHDLALILRYTGTQGIEQIIDWFEKRSEILKSSEDQHKLVNRRHNLSLGPVYSNWGNHFATPVRLDGDRFFEGASFAFFRCPESV